LQDQLAEEKKKLAEMSTRGGPVDDDELAQEMEDSHREIQNLNQVFPFHVPADDRKLPKWKRNYSMHGENSRLRKISFNRWPRNIRLPAKK
jgi:hypothetical protein